MTAAESEDRVNIGALEEFFLDRLRRFSKLGSEAEASEIASWRELTRRATFMAYRDCALIGLEEEAKQVLAETPDRRTTSRRARLVSPASAS